MANKNNMKYLITELNNLSQNLEALLGTSADISKEQLTQLRNNAQKALSKAKTVLVENSIELVDKTKHGAYLVDAYAKENPWKTASIAAAIAAIVGCCLTKK